MFSVRLARLFVPLLLLAVLIFVGCQRSGDGPQASDSGIEIALQPMPLEDTLVVVLTDADGASVSGATVGVEGNMNHAGMIPVLADPIADDADGSADGRYHLPFTFTMLGDWILTVTVTQADGSSFSRNLEVRAGSDGISGDEVMPPEGGAGEQSNSAPGGEVVDAAASAPVSVPISVHNAAARPAPLVGGTGAVYFALHNNSDAPVTLTGAESGAAGAIEIHTTINDNGVLRMRQLPEGIAIAPGEHVELSPGAMHLMLIDLTAALVEGESLDLTLHFDGADDLALTVPVVNMDDLPAEAEMEHDH